MSQPITELLSRLSRGERVATDDLTALVYDRLREIAERQLRDEDARQFDATEIVHQAYLRLLGATPIAWTDRTHFFATASKVIRQVLVDAARKRRRIERGGHGWSRCICSETDPGRSRRGARRVAPHRRRRLGDGPGVVATRTQREPMNRSLVIFMIGLMLAVSDASADDARRPSIV